MDKAHEQTDRLLHALENALTRLYAQASREMQREIKSLLDEIYLDDVTATPAQRLRYAEKNGNKDKLIDIIVAYTILANEEAIKRINKQLDKIYTVNHLSVIDKIHKNTGIRLAAEGFNLDRLLSRYTKRAYNRNTNTSHAEREIVKEIEKMLKRGDGTKKIAKRIKKVFGKSEVSAKTITLTETTRIQAHARLGVMQEASKRGMVFEKIWRHAPYVQHPRDWHIKLDGASVDLDKPFITAEGNALMHPGDPNAPALETINCHCFLDERLIDW